MNFIKLLTKNKIWFSIVSLLVVILTISNIYLLKNIIILNGIENFMRFIACLFLVTLWILLILFSIKSLLKNNKKMYIIYIILTIIYSSILWFVGYNIDKVYSTIDKISNNSTMYSSSIITLEENEVSNIKGIGNSSIGILNDETSIDGYQIPKEIIKNQKMSNELTYYDGYTDLLDALKEGEIKYIFLPTNYGVMFNSIEGYSDFEKITKIIYTKEKEVTKEVVNKGSSIKEPFTILIMGVDSEKENIKGATFNGDALMLITFNPKTLNSTILSIPRDTYVPIACFAGQRKNKITHAAWYGEDCMINTIENFTGIEIDYYLKINFKGVVNLVDALGGIDVDVPYSFCEQDSNRNWGNNTVYVREGKGTLTGEQVLAFARNRHPNPNMCSEEWTNYDSNDFVRGQNQQIIVKSLLNKAKSIKSLDTVYKLLDTISNSMETNMSTNQILSFYNIGKDILAKSKDNKVEDIIGMQRLYISGYDKYIFDYSMLNNQGTRQTLYNFVPYKGSVTDVVKAMNINLGNKQETIIKNFSFDVNDDYKETVIGKGYYNETAIELLPDFTNKQESVAKIYASKNNIQLTVEYVTSKDSNQTLGQIIKQSTYSGMDISYVNKLAITVINKMDIEQTDPTPTCSLEENKDNELCKIPNFVGKNYSDFITWKNAHKDLSIRFVESEIKDGEDNYDVNKKSVIVYQSLTDVSIYDLIGNVFEIRYISSQSTSSSSE